MYNIYFLPLLRFLTYACVYVYQYVATSCQLRMHPFPLISLITIFLLTFWLLWLLTSLTWLFAFSYALSFHFVHALHSTSAGMLARVCVCVCAFGFTASTIHPCRVSAAWSSCCGQQGICGGRKKTTSNKARHGTDPHSLPSVTNLSTPHIVTWWITDTNAHKQISTRNYISILLKYVFICVCVCNEKRTTRTFFISCKTLFLLIRRELKPPCNKSMRVHMFVVVTKILLYSGKQSTLTENYNNSQLIKMLIPFVFIWS